MPELVAQGPQPQDRWRRRVPVDETIVLGRACEGWSVPWDSQISRRHIELHWHDQRLEIHVLPETVNPVFVRGHAANFFVLRPGEHFVIGSTTFTLVDERVEFSPELSELLSEQSFSPHYLQQLRFRNADQRIDVLSRLPEIISGASSDSELFVRLTNVLLAGIPRASAIAIVAAATSSTATDFGVAVSAEPPRGRETSPVELLHWDRRVLTGDELRPSTRLIRQAVETGEAVVHVWAGRHRQDSHFTESENIDWAFCVPVTGQACPGWAIYVAGTLGQGLDPRRLADSADLRDDIKFTKLAAITLGNLRELRMLEQSRASLRQFFSPVVLDALTREDPEVVLAPREAYVSVLFCDLRGFSRRSESAADDLLGLLQRVSQALGVMTHHILFQGGVVGDFHGDAAMGFWGWPLAIDDPERRAAEAALRIRAEFFEAARREDHPLSGFRAGIGLASGNAVAGKIGTVDQVKVTVFGPVVNLAARLQDLTKNLRAPILLDEVTARAIREHVPRELARVRRVARVRPYGLQTAVEVSELLPPERDYPLLRDEHIAQYEAALDALLNRDWSGAFHLLHQVPAEDRVKDFLTVYIAQHNRTPPENWDGVIPLR